MAALPGSSKDSALCWANTPKVAGSLQPGAPMGTSRDVPSACPCPVTTARQRLAAPCECKRMSSTGLARVSGWGAGGVGPEEGTVCPYAGTLCPPQAQLSSQQRRQHLAAGPSGPSLGLGLQDMAHRHPPSRQLLAAAPPALACPQLRDGAGGPVAAIATATRLCLKPSSEMSRLSWGSSCRCRDENFLPGSGNVLWGWFPP